MNSGLLLFLESISGGEMILVFFVFLMLFGSKNIPDVARSLGKAMRQFKEATSEIQRDIEHSSRQLKNQIENETRGITSDLQVDVMEPNAPAPGQRWTEEDRLAGSSTPPPRIASTTPVVPVTPDAPIPPSPTSTAPETPVDIPVTPTTETPSA